MRFVPLKAPPDEEVKAILRRVVVRLLRLLRPQAEQMDFEPLDALRATSGVVSKDTTLVLNSEIRLVES